MWVKICGIQSERDLQTALRSGADAVGFICGTKEFSKDAIDRRDVRALVSLVPWDTETVLVTDLQDPREISGLLQYSLCSRVQVQPAVSVDLPSIQTIHIDNLLPEIPSADRLLLDSGSKNNPGGTGQTHDWNISAEVCQAFSGECILAGGLSPENVQEAIRAVGPWGVDANSCLKDVRGHKDEQLCKKFVRLAKSAT